MEEHESTMPSNGRSSGVADFPSHVQVALDHVQPEEREGVLLIVSAFARGEAVGRRLPGSDPLFTLQAAPDLRVIVRREQGVPLQVIDVVRPATLRAFANAAPVG